jgi:polyhydroxyalkanoate synthesis regulator phasin
MELGSMQTIERELRVQCEALDPDSVPLPDVLAVFRSLERMAKLVEGAKLRLARKLEEANVGRLDGCRDTAEFLAKATGTSIGIARDTLETSKRLDEQRATDAAVAKGHLSAEQARAVSDAVVADPSAERGLLNSAHGQTIRELKQRCAQVKANAHPDDRARCEAIRRSRACRTWTGTDGAWNLHVRHVPEVGAEIEALLSPFTHARFEAGRKAGSYEAREAYRADALLDLARDSTTGSTPKGANRADTKVFVHIDLETLQSGAGPGRPATSTASARSTSATCGRRSAKRSSWR